MGGLGNEIIMFVIWESVLDLPEHAGNKSFGQLVIGSNELGHFLSCLLVSLSSVCYILPNVYQGNYIYSICS
jgi:hypothetical protein